MNPTEEQMNRRIDAWRAYVTELLGLESDAILGDELTVVLVALAEHRDPPALEAERSPGYDPRGFFFVVIEGVRLVAHPEVTVEERVRLTSQLLAYPVARGGEVAERLARQWVPGSEVTLHDAMTAFAAGLVADAEVKLELELEDDRE